MEYIMNKIQKMVKQASAPPVLPHGIADDKFSWTTLAHFLGPGIVVSIAYIDPGNFLSDIISGAAFNYSLLWVLAMASGLALLLQILAARLGTVTGLHLAECCRQEYGHRTRTTIGLWIISELAIIASDIPEVVGSAFALKMLFDMPLWAGVLVTSVNTMIFLGIQAFGIQKLEALITAFVGIMGICFIVEAILSPVTWFNADCMSDEEWYQKLECEPGAPDCPGNYCGNFFSGFLPVIHIDQLFIAISLIGAVVMPHNLYLHSALVQTRHIDRRCDIQVKWANFYTAVECAIGLVVSFIINVAVIISAASVFFPSKENNWSIVKDIDSIGFEQASDLLGHSLGHAASVLFAIALLASGQSSTITGTFAGQFVMDGFLKIKIAAWKRNILTRTVAIGPSLLICLLAGDRGANLLIVVSSVILSFQLPFALVPLLRFTSDPEIMGRFVNSYRMIITCSILSSVVIMANVYLIYATVFGEGNSTVYKIFAGGFGCVLGIVYFIALGYLLFRPMSGSVKPNNEDGFDLSTVHEEGAVSSDEDAALMKNTVQSPIATREPEHRISNGSSHSYTHTPLAHGNGMSLDELE
eukprot:Clim_evm82s134 gene=Clim_evmTU82s134